MSETINVDKVLDLKGLPCPMPVVKVSKGYQGSFRRTNCRGHLQTDPGALSDFPAWARTSGNEIIKTEQNGKETHFFIKRNA